jgi:hypothetical protein
MMSSRGDGSESEGDGDIVCRVAVIISNRIGFVENPSNE